MSRPAAAGAQVWLSDPRLNGIIVGPAGIELMADRRTLLLDTGGGGTDPATGKLYTRARSSPATGPGPSPSCGRAAPLEAPDGFAIARSGNVYIALVGPTGNAVVELSPHGSELARVTMPAANPSGAAIPFDAPGSAAFDGNELLVANQASILVDPAHWAILAVDAGEPGLPPSLPPPPPPPPTTYALTRLTPLHPRSACCGPCTSAPPPSPGAAAAPPRGRIVELGGRRARINRSGRASLRIRLNRRAVLRAELLVHGRPRATAVLGVG